MSNCHSFLLKFTYQAWIVSGHVCVSYRYRLYLYFDVCVIFITNLPRGSIMRTYLISIIHKQRYFISSVFDMYCGGCDNIPFWRWLKLNQTFSTSVTCSDCDGEKLSNLQANNVTDCFSEYLSTFGFESVIKFIVYEVKFDPTKGVIRNCKSNDRQHNDKRKKTK